MKILMVLAVLISNPVAGWAFYCSEPTAPDAPGNYYRPEKPSAPYCVNTFSNTHTCDDWEIDAYNADLAQYRSDVSDYIRKLKDYISEAEIFYNEVVDYAKCEADNIE